ncbi:MAG TPA: hypothetical protein VK034_20065 [Enhygromyxa sp.]|nr:hypothetical protein [Enhygromyxa sp.]
MFACSASKPPEDSERPDDSQVGPIEAEPDGGPEPVEPAPPDQTVELDGVRLGLVAADCLLTAELGEQRLVHRFDAAPGACAFASDEAGAVRIVATDQGPAVMVESSRPLERDCETMTRVVVVTKQGPRVSRAAQRVAMCAPFAWDEMMFHVLASEPVEFGTASVEP